jgi:hypothetical protein
MPLAPAYDWTELLVAFDDFTAAATFAAGTGQRGRHPDQARHRLEAPIGKLFPARLPHVEEGTNLVILLVAPHPSTG